MDLFYSNSSLFWCMAPKYVTKQLCRSQYVTSKHQLRRLSAAKFFSSSTRWRSRRCLVTKPYGAKYTATSSRERDELGQVLRLRSQFAWTEFSQCLCNLCTVWQLLKQSFYISRIKRKKGPKTYSRIPRKSDLNSKILESRQIGGVEKLSSSCPNLMNLYSLLDFLNKLEGFNTWSWNMVSWSI